MSYTDVDNLEEAKDILDDLIGVLQELHYRLEHIEDLEEYGLIDNLIATIGKVLARYDAFE